MEVCLRLFTLSFCALLWLRICDTLHLRNSIRDVGRALMDESRIAVGATRLELSWPSPGSWWFVAACCLLALVPLLIPVVAAQDARFLMYPYGATLNLLGAGFCVALARRQIGRARAQWVLLGIQFAMLSLSLWVPTVSLSTGWPVKRVTAWLISGLASASFMFCPLCGLNFLISFSTGPSGFSNYHLQVSFTTVIFLLLAAEAARRSAGTETERQFAGIVTAYLCSRVVTLFVVNILNAVLLKTPRELPFDLFYGLPQLSFSVLAFYQLQGRPGRVRLGKPNALWASALPSILVLASVLLALHVMTEYPVLGGLSIGVSVVCFILRTHLMYQRMLNEQQALITRTGQLETLASNDPLTGIGNRRWFEQMAIQLLLAGPETRSALLLIDTDRFKQINDTFGHRAGDQLLATIGEAIQEEMSGIAGACCARIGGDEFAALLPHVGPAMAQEAAERLRRRIEAMSWEYPDCRASISVGVAASSGRVQLSSLLELADEALYRAKRRGRNVVEVEAQDAVQFSRVGRRSDQRVYRGNA